MAAVDDQVRNLMDAGRQMIESPGLQRVLSIFRKHYRDATPETYNTGCLIYTTVVIYHLVASREASGFDFLVISFFILGALAFIGSKKTLSKLKETYDENYLVNALKVVNKYFFMILSLAPGLYFAIKYEEHILRFYLLVHFVTTGYFFYKRFKDFELYPFLVGLGMSFCLGSIGYGIRGFFGIFGAGWIATTMASTLVTFVDISLAVAFMLRLPDKHLPTSMIFGLKIVKYLMFLSSWQTFFMLMVMVSWKNIGSLYETVVELYAAAEKENPEASASKRVEGDSKTK